MRRVTYKSIQDAVAGFMGFDPENLSVNDQATLNRHINRRAQFAWESFFWPEWTLVEARTFRPAWDSASTFAAKAEVYYRATKKYYCSLVSNSNQAPADSSGVLNSAYWAESQGIYSAPNYSTTSVYTRGQQVYYPNTDKFYQLYASSTTGTLPTDATKWGELVAFERTVDYAQTGFTQIADVKQVWDVNPRTAPRCARPVNFFLQESGIRCAGCVNLVWVEYRKLVPSWTGAVYASGSKAAGTQVYWTDGDYYTANSTTTTDPSNTTDWTRIDFPYVLSKYVVEGAYADTLSKTEQQQDRYPTEADEAFQLLGFEWDKIERQQQQDSQLNVIGSC